MGYWVIRGRCGGVVTRSCRIRHTKACIAKGLSRGGVKGPSLRLATHSVYETARTMGSLNIEWEMRKVRGRYHLFAKLHPSLKLEKSIPPSLFPSYFLIYTHLHPPREHTNMGMSVLILEGVNLGCCRYKG